MGIRVSAQGVALLVAAAGLTCTDGDDVGVGDDGVAVVGAWVGDGDALGDAWGVAVVLGRAGFEDADGLGRVVDVVGPAVGPVVALEGSPLSRWSTAASTRPASLARRSPVPRARATSAFMARRSCRASA